MPDNNNIDKLVNDYHIPKPSSIENSDQLFNVCCFLYLREVYIGQKSSDQSLEKKEELERYKENYPYGNRYALFLRGLDVDNKNVNFSNKYHLIYLNNNKSLEYVEAVLKAKNWLTEGNIDRAEHIIQDKLSQSVFYSQLNDITPENAGSPLGRFVNTVASSIGGDFKPMLETSIPQIKTYAYKSNSDKELPTELRFGTQAQFHNGQARISPLFKHFIDEQKDKSNPSKITHVYFNLLKYAQGGYERDKEAALSEQLHQLEKNHSNIAVITLPADDEILKADYITYEDAGKLQSLKDKVINKVTNPGKKDDFCISEKVREVLFDNADDFEDQWKNKVELLWNKSLEHFQFQNRENLTKTEFQAVYFHFFKYELPNFILDKLQPHTFNMSCKDAIDRGGVASLYYNVNKAVSLGKKLTNSEFINKGLHAAPIEVKGRGLNHHEKFLCNAIYQGSNIDNDRYSHLGDNSNTISIKTWCEKKRPVELKKEEIVYKIKQNVQQNNDASYLTNLIQSINNGKKDSSSPYHELWHQKSGLSNSYQGQYGNTFTGEYVVNYIGDEINKNNAKKVSPQNPPSLMNADKNNEPTFPSIGVYS
ncbi:MAG: hypothetical protein EP298_00975 [Gammaproteobacteria bacterium]|nr:MAG: hypothetical protein EP298_00975 [Gammaproteobacteria bacterium]UTW41925.1 hypothetical protein KFE69_10485 [bacterium SCSIO 12844]